MERQSKSVNWHIDVQRVMECDLRNAWTLLGYEVMLAPAGLEGASVSVLFWGLTMLTGTLNRSLQARAVFRVVDVVARNDRVRLVLEEVSEAPRAEFSIAFAS